MNDNDNDLGKVDQYHGCWCPGSFVSSGYQQPSF